MTVLPLLLAVLVGARFSDADPRGGSSGAKRYPVAEGVTAEVVYSPRALQFVFRGEGEPAGRFVVQVRPGARNPSTPVAPFAYAFEARPGGRVENLVPPAPQTRETPRVDAVVSVERGKAGKGWIACAAFPFRGRLGFWPFRADGKRPPNWYATVRYEDGSGKAADWGAPNDPLQISWGATPAFKKARDGLFMDPRLVEPYRAARSRYCDTCSSSQKEKWIGYPDPGVETFAWRQADSEKAFQDAFTTLVTRDLDDAMALLEFRLSKDRRSRNVPPKALDLAEPAKAKLFGRVDDFTFAEETLSKMRLQYLRDRFMGRAVEAAPPPKPKKEKKTVEKSPETLEDEETISLDDDELKF